MSGDSRVAVVTGAGSGIGRSVAQALSRERYQVVLAGRQSERLEATKATVPEKEAIHVVPADVTDAASVAHLFQETVARFGRVDLLFNNAGINVPAVALDELSIDAMRSIIDVNLTGALLCAREAMRVMKTQTPPGGRIINNGSVSAHSPRPNSTLYSATKHAITGLTKSIALDGRSFDIACGQIDIGNAVTNLTERMQTGVLQADGHLAPEPRMDLVHIARAVVFMASLPLDVNIPFMTIMATKMPLFGRG